MTTIPPELSIIVPVLNDTDELRCLLDCLSAQKAGNLFEVIICSGAADEELRALANDWNTTGSFQVRLISTARGRGRQMNAGAAAASGTFLLFLHADSRFDAEDALSSALDSYHKLTQGTLLPDAARFKLHFRQSGKEASLAYYYHEAKARLNREDCIRGDQGYLVSRTAFEMLGRFDTALPFLEDVRMAARVAECGEWHLLQADISTSARRFETEGFYERQVANVIIVNAVATGWSELLAALPALYSCNSGGRLQLYPLLSGVRSLINNHEQHWRKEFWNATGAHVASNAWQLFFWLDVRHAFVRRYPVDSVTTRWLNLYNRRLKPLFESRAAGRLATLLTRIWFQWMLNRTRNTFQENR